MCSPINAVLTFKCHCLSFRKSNQFINEKSVTKLLQLKIHIFKTYCLLSSQFTTAFTNELTRTIIEF